MKTRLSQRAPFSYRLSHRSYIYTCYWKPVFKKKRVWKLKTCTNRHMYITFLQIKNSIKLYTWKIYITKDKHTDHFTMHLTRVGIGPKQKDLKSDTYDKMTPNIHPSTLFVSCGVCITFSTFDDKAFFLFLNYYWIFTDPPTPV